MKPIDGFDDAPGRVLVLVIVGCAGCVEEETSNVWRRRRVILKPRK